MYDAERPVTFCAYQLGMTSPAEPEPARAITLLVSRAQLTRSSLAQEYGILSVFETRPELSTSELARISQVTRQTMHTSVLSLEAAGLVERGARNQRVVLVRPTKRGRQCLETATRRVRVVEHAALADLSRQDERTVRAWLASLAAPTTGPKKAEAEQKEKS